MSANQKERKQNYFNKLIALTQEYPKILIVNADNVGSRQLQQVRTQLRGHAVVLMGKNTMMRKAIKLHTAASGNNKLEKLLPYIKGNMGFVFVKDDLHKARDIIVANKVGAPAKQGSISPVNVVVPAINTGLEPTKTSFFQALNIPTKITRGTVEIINEVTLLKVGDKVGSSEAALLQMLGIKPFHYGLKIVAIYDNGSIYSPAILDITDEDLAAKFQAGINNIAAFSLAINFPTQASIPHSIINSYKNLLAVAVATDYSFPQAEELKAYIANPGAFAVAAAPAAAAPAAAPAKKEEPKVEEESDEDMGLDLFG
eukprot:GEZU01042254.1.p1 GENE.GEZU01042254.1~~GEZU01042254.1.p1  ORF type:complete len:351 (+),score=146.70 GEZU01042254.1:113-1054(+)